MGVNEFALLSSSLQGSEIRGLAEEAGVEIRPPAILSNSSFALIGSEYAKEAGKFESFRDTVFRAYWWEGKNIGDISVLSMIAEKVGLSTAGMKSYIKEGRWADSIERNRRTARGHNVSGVPTFIVGRQQVVGAQPHEAIRSVFLKEFVPNPKFPKVDGASQAEGVTGAESCDMVAILMKWYLKSDLKAIHVVYANWCSHCVPTTVQPMEKAANELGVPCILYDIDSEAEQKADEPVKRNGDWSPDYIIPQVFLEFDGREFKHVLTGYSEGVAFTKRAVENFLKSPLYQSLKNRN